MSRHRGKTATNTYTRSTSKAGARGGQLSHDMQQLLKRLLLTISKGEKSIERQRQKLARNDKFEPYAAFMRVDRDENGVVGSVEVLRFLRENGVEEATEADCYLIVKYFDSDEDGYLNFQDFLQMLLPCDNQYLRASVAQRPNYPVSRTDFLGTEIESDLTRLFEKEIAFNRVTEEMKQVMESSKAFDYNKAYQSIDDWNYGYVDKRNLKMFLKKHGHIATNEDVVAIIRRMDLDADARLTKAEFIEGIKPEEPYSKAMKRQASKSRSKKREKRDKTPTFRNHSRKSSVTSRYSHTKQYDKPGEMLILSEKQRDPIRVQALDRSMTKIHSSRSPLKSRPNLREIDAYSHRFHTPKAGKSKFQSLPRTPRSNKDQYGGSVANRSFTGGINYSGKRNFSRQKLSTSQTRKQSRPLTSGGAYTLSRMMKPGALIKSQYTHHQGSSNMKTIKNTYRKIRDEQKKSAQHKTHHKQGSSGSARMYNYRQLGNARRTMDEDHRYNRYMEDQQSIQSQTLVVGGSRAEYEPVHNRTFNMDRHTHLKFDMDRASEKTRLTRPLASGDEISYMRHGHNIENDGISSNHSRRGVLIPGMTSNFGGGVESLNSTLQVNQSSSKRGEPTNRDQSPVNNNFSQVSPYLRNNGRSQGHLRSHQQEYLPDQSPAEEAASNYSKLRKEGISNRSVQVREDIGVPSASSESRRSKHSQKEPKEKRALFEAFSDFIQIERDLERMKIEITLKDDYNLIDAFGILDVQGKGFISPVELREALCDLGFKCNIDEIHLVFERFNTSADGVLKYSEFSESMMPQDQHYARLLGTKKLQIVTKPGKMPFEKSTISKYLLMWDLIVQNEKAIESIRQKMQKKYIFDNKTAFNLCDTNKDGYITISELRQFLFEQDCYASSDDLQLLMNRFDKNRDSRICFKEFEMEMTPKSPFNY